MRLHDRLVGDEGHDLSIVREPCHLKDGLAGWLLEDIATSGGIGTVRV